MRGELVRQSADTIWLRTASDADLTRLLLRPRSRLRAAAPTDPGDPWMVGDSLREKRIRGSNQFGWDYWTVVERTDDGLVLGNYQSAPESFGTPLTTSHSVERYVVRPRPTQRFIGGAALVGAGVLGMVLFKKAQHDPEPVPIGEFDISAGELVVVGLLTGVVSGGIALLITAPMARPGWEPIGDDDLPPLVRSSPTAEFSLRLLH